MKRIHRAAVFVALSLCIGGGAAWATGFVGSAFVAADGSITACIQKDSYQVRIVHAGSACRSTEIAQTLSQRGP